MNNYLGSLDYMNDLANGFGSGLTDEEIRNANMPLLGGVQGKISPLENFAMGFEDNYKNGFNTNNLRLMNLQDKPISNRLGEGFGTALRVIDSPLGRGLLSAGLTAALGGNASTVAKEGLSGFVGRQNAVTADKLYRNQLKQYGYTDDDLAQINGNITDDVYKNLTTNVYRNQQLQTKMAIANAKDKTTKAKLIMDGWKNGTLSEQDALTQFAINGINLNELNESNQTRNTDSQINYRAERLKQIDTNLALLDKKISLSSANSAARLQLQKQRLALQEERQKIFDDLRKQNYELNIALKEQELGYNTPKTRPVRQTTPKNTGLKLVGVRNK